MHSVLESCVGAYVTALTSVDSRVTPVRGVGLEDSPRPECSGQVRLPWPYHEVRGGGFVCPARPWSGKRLRSASPDLSRANC